MKPEIKAERLVSFLEETKGILSWAIEPLSFFIRFIADIKIWEMGHLTP